MRPIVVTGFEPYGRHPFNPSHEIMRALDGKLIEGAEIVGRPLPVSFRDLKSEVMQILEELEPSVVISVGLCPGEAIIRLERIGINIADFEIPDNDGSIQKDAAISDNGEAARFATLPLRDIEAALLKTGIPCRISATAGTFLCNACLYSFLEATEARWQQTLCGFMHVPYVPEQVAQLMARFRAEGRGVFDKQVDLSSMDLAMQINAVQIAISETVRIGRGGAAR
jgi:pyroglutamyl-peptidase